MKIRWIGQFNHSGFGVESTGMVKALLAMGHQVHAVPYPQGCITEGVDDIKAAFEPQVKEWPDRTVVHAMPPPMDVDVDVDVLWLNYELQPMPAAWSYTLNHAKVLLAESEHAKQCFTTITNRDIGIVPSGIDVGFGTNFKGKRAAGDNEFAFLSVFEWVPRKQGELLIRAFCEEFKDDPGVSLFVKTCFGAGNPRAEIPRILADYPAMKDRVLLVSQHFDDMGLIYPAFDGYVLPSALEGWGITFMEAIACGLKPVVPGAGGTEMFCTPENSYMVPMGDWEPATSFAEGLFAPDARWRVPSKGALKASMRHAYEQKERLTPEYTKAFRAKWSWENAAKKLLEAME